MCGRAYGPRFMWMWPNARIGVMGGEQAAGVLCQVKEAQAAKAGSPLSPNELDSYRAEIRGRFDDEAEVRLSEYWQWVVGAGSSSRTGSR